MKETKARLSFELYIECPHCGHDFDVEREDNYNDEGEYSSPLFNNDWEHIDVHETCPKCEGEFIVTDIEY